MTDETKSMVEQYSWPGNVRELVNTLQKALIFCRGYPIGPEGIFQAVQVKVSEAPVNNEEADVLLRQWVRETLSAGGAWESFTSCLDRLTRIIISEALDLTRGNRSQAARLLGLSRPTLLAKMKKCGYTKDGAEI
ncbi:MAG: sigma-54-dependent Fis family transcriptional regulator, partial [Planctomycetes bacterium]|nr:sigma-54-dependent Fis family transcriptional regulator [Planctomycetota bacterium]